MGHHFVGYMYLIILANEYHKGMNPWIIVDLTPKYGVSIGFLIWTFFLYFPKIHGQKIIRNQTINAENFVKREGFCGGMIIMIVCKRSGPWKSDRGVLATCWAGVHKRVTINKDKYQLWFKRLGLSSSIFRKCHTYYTYVLFQPWQFSHLSSSHPSMN
jgi:hypothetical protein